MSLINKVASIIDNKAELEKVAYMPNKVSYDDNLAILNIDLKSIIPKPPSNTSSTTAREIKEVAKATQNRSVKELDLIYVVDKEPLNLFYDFTEARKLEFPKAIFHDYYNILEQYVFALKYYYNRARPEQLSPYYNLDINVLYTDTHHTASYPSGHTMYAELAAHICSDVYPQHRDDFFRLSKYCGLARILQGVHYPSDNKASVIAVKKLYPLIRGYYEQRRTQENPLDRRSTT